MTKGIEHTGAPIDMFYTEIALPLLNTPGTRFDHYSVSPHIIPVLRPTTGAILTTLSSRNGDHQETYMRFTGLVYDIQPQELEYLSMPPDQPITDLVVACPPVTTTTASDSSKPYRIVSNEFADYHDTWIEPKPKPPYCVTVYGDPELPGMYIKLDDLIVPDEISKYPSVSEACLSVAGIITEHYLGIRLDKLTDEP